MIKQKVVTNMVRQRVQTINEKSDINLFHYIEYVECK